MVSRSSGVVAALLLVCLNTVMAQALPPVPANDYDGTVSVLLHTTTSDPAIVISPAPNSTLTGSSVTFQWTASGDATAYWIDVGSVPGGNQYYQSGSLPTTTLSATVSGLPTDGSTIYVTMYSLISGQWVYNSYTYTAFNSGNSKGAITAPAPGSTLSGSTVAFTWTAGTSATAYWLDVGNVPAGNQYYQSGNLGNVLTTMANGLPTDGSTVYATLYSLVDGQWLSNAYIYTAYNASGARGVITTPTPGSTFTGSTVTFDWTAGTGASAYWLDVGNVPGGNQYFQSGNLGNVLTVAVNNLPTNGSTVYVTLYSLVGGQWVANAYTYTAFNPAGALGVMQTPIPHSVLIGSTVTFTWSAGSLATAYWLDIGNVPGGNQYYQSGNLGNVLTTTVNSLPADGSIIYVTLYSYVGSQWLYNQYLYYSEPLTPETLIMSIVLDRSGSMSTDGGGSALQSAVPTFVNYFNQTTDEVALVSFSSNATVDFPINYNFITPISNAVAALRFVGGTFGTGAGTQPILSNTVGAPLSLAQLQNDSVVIPPGQNALKVVVYFTDGLMNTIQDNFHCGGINNNNLTLLNYGGFDSGTTVDIFDPTSPTTVFATYSGGNGFAYDSQGDICRNAQGQNVTTFPSQQYGTQQTLTRANVTAEAQYRAIQTAISLRTENPIPTFIYTLGLGNSVSLTTQALLGQLANDPAYPATYINSQPAGEFFYIPDCPSSACTAELNLAFQTIASKLLSPVKSLTIKGQERRNGVRKAMVSPGPSQ